MLNIKNIILIMVILFLFNKIKINNKEDNFTNMNTNKSNTYKISKRIPKYGDIQYNAYDNDNDDLIFKYQDFEPIKNDTKLELSEGINNINKYNQLTKLNSDIPKLNKMQTNTNKFIKTNLPSEQDIIYDTKFFQPSDADIFNPFDPTKINYSERKIQEVYEEIINDVKRNTPNKKITKRNKKKDGGFGESTYKSIDWEYENDDDGMSYDPKLSNLLAL